jgi:hypothetical protein
MIRSGDLPALKVGGQWRLRESQLISWIKVAKASHSLNDNRGASPDNHSGMAIGEQRIITAGTKS